MSRGADGAIELRSFRPATSNILDVYNGLRQQEKDKKAREKLLRAFAGSIQDAMKFSHSIQVRCYLVPAACLPLLTPLRS